jgi:hypothetical protein
MYAAAANSSMGLNDWLAIGGLVIIFLLVMLFLPSFMINLNVPKVIKILRKHSATRPETAKIPKEMGLAQPSFVERLWKLRDYKPRALQFLLQYEIVQMTDDGRVFLSEDKLALTKWSKL